MTDSMELLQSNSRTQPYCLRKHIPGGVNQIDLKAMSSFFLFQMDSHGQSNLAAETNDELISGGQMEFLFWIFLK